MEHKTQLNCGSRRTATGSCEIHYRVRSWDCARSINKLKDAKGRIVVFLIAKYVKTINCTERS